MKTLAKLLAVIGCLAWAEGGWAAPDEDAAALIQQMVESRKSRGAVIRAKLSVEENGRDESAVAQIVIKERRDDEVTRVLYQALWPTARKGEALLVTRSRKEGVSGFLFKPPNELTELTTNVMASAYLDSDVTIEDIAEDFWAWGSPKLIGQELIKGVVCKIVELRPPEGSASAYSLIKAWVSPERLLPMRVEKFHRDGRLARTFVISKSLRHEKVWSPKILIVQRAGAPRQTVIDISRGNSDTEIPLEEFSLEHIRKKK